MRSNFMTELNNTQPLKRYKILVLGDNCIDVYHYGIVDRLSPEAPVPIFTPTHQTEKPGMAANVSLNLKSFSCDVNYICDQYFYYIFKLYIYINNL